MLDLRGLYFSERSPRAPGGPDAPASAETTFSVKMSDIRFDTSRIIGNMGATLNTRWSSGDNDFDFDDENIQYSSQPFSVGLLNADDTPWYVVSSVNCI